MLTRGTVRPAAGVNDLCPPQGATQGRVGNVLFRGIGTGHPGRTNVNERATYRAALPGTLRAKPDKRGAGRFLIAGTVSFWLSVSIQPY